MGRIWAVARLTISEGLRMKVAVVFICVILILLTALPFSVEGDGLTLKSRVQSFLAYSLGAVSVLLGLLTVFLSCASVANEIRLKQIFMVVSKPIPRWQVFCGKWLGISTINAVMLMMTWLAVWSATMLVSHQGSDIPDDKKGLEEEVLTIRHGVQPTAPDFVAAVEANIRRLREEGRLDDVTPDQMPAIRTARLEEVKLNWRRLEPREYQDFRFDGLIVDREPGHFVLLNIKPRSPVGADDVFFETFLQCGDPNDRNTQEQTRPNEFVVGRFHVIPIPARCVNRHGTLYLRIFNLNRRDAILFEGTESFELLLGLGTFHWNLFRALTMIWCRMAFLAAVGLLLSSFLSFPVACMGCLLIWIVSSGAGFLADAINMATPAGNQEDPMWIFGPVLRPIAQAFVWLVPDFSKHNPVESVTNGRNVTLMWVIHSLTILVLIKGLILGCLGALILTKREVAQVTA